MSVCVCGCPCSHDPHCEHGCTLSDTPDDGDEHGGSCVVSRSEHYDGRYQHREDQQ